MLDERKVSVNLNSKDDRVEFCAVGCSIQTWFVCFSSSECVFPARSMFFQLAECFSGSQHGFKFVIQHAVDV